MRSIISALLALISGATLAATPIPVNIALPGPMSMPYLPVELINRIGADSEQGLKVNLRYFGGGPLALKDMLGGNSDFASLGFPAFAVSQDIQGKAYAVASMVHVPAFTLMARKGGRIKTVADLRGGTIGVHGSTKKGKSTGQQIAEYLVARVGVPARQVNFVSAGQNYASYSAALMSGSVDAVITDEPSASRMEATGIAFRLADLHDPATARRQFGSLLLYTQLCTRADVIQHQTDLVNRVVAALLRTLKWMQQHSAREIVERMDVRDPRERALLITALERNKTMFSPDGVFSDEQIKGAAALLRAVQDGAQPNLEALVDAQWVGRRP